MTLKVLTPRRKRWPLVNVTVHVARIIKRPKDIVKASQRSTPKV
jgi:hypothetical protein